MSDEFGVCGSCRDLFKSIEENHSTANLLTENLTLDIPNMKLEQTLICDVQSLYRMR